MTSTIDNAAGSLQKLIEATITLMSSRGFDAMGIHSILEAANVSKSNFYYHFKSKEDLCLAALDAMAEYFFSQYLDPVLLNKSMSPRKRLEKFLRSLADKMESASCQSGCPFVNLATETSDFLPAFRERISLFFERYQKSLAQCIQEGIERGEFRSDVSPALAAQLLLASVNGTMVLTKVHKNPQVMKNCIRALMSMMAAK
jgi:TetR/AcrR family transcriptional regulator, transcriptional repressor for nem operon